MQLFLAQQNLPQGNTIFAVDFQKSAAVATELEQAERLDSKSSFSKHHGANYAESEVFIGL